MNIAVLLKENLKNIPPNIGRLINKLPYNYRPGIGKAYRTRRKEIIEYDDYSTKEKKEFIFARMKHIVSFAYENVYAYKQYYNQNGFNPNHLKTFDDIERIPIINKGILNKYMLGERSFPKKGRYIVNTGGSSGTPFGFYIEPSSMGHEWAHMHTIWEKLSFKSSDLKLGFGGRSDVKDLIEYDVVRNTFALDQYASLESIAKRLKKIAESKNIKYLHGYPSSIYEFAVYCRDNDQTLRNLLSKQLQGAFLGSEFPHPHYRVVIQDVFKIDTISWYGHTERAVLAYEKDEHFIYVPFQTYGYTEAKVIDNEVKLIATSYYNEASPLIRYNTEDEIKNPVIKSDILESFEMKGGRSGEFVIDKSGRKINLTGLIFGRHHELFNHAEFIQVKQIKNGSIEIHYVSDSVSTEKASLLFDKNNADFDFTFIQKKEPVRTKAGKVSLLIK